MSAPCCCSYVQCLLSTSIPSIHLDILPALQLHPLFAPSLHLLPSPLSTSTTRDRLPCHGEISSHDNNTRILLNARQRGDGGERKERASNYLPYGSPSRSPGKGEQKLRHASGQPSEGPLARQSLPRRQIQGVVRWVLASASILPPTPYFHERRDSHLDVPCEASRSIEHDTWRNPSKCDFIIALEQHRFRALGPLLHSFSSSRF